MKGHNGKVRTVSWSLNDAKIVSGGADGAVYEWSVKEFRRLSENIVKTCSYSAAIPSADARHVYAVGSDKTFKEIIDSQITRDLPMEEILTQVFLKSKFKT